MFQAKVHLQQHAACVVSQLAEEFDTVVPIAVQKRNGELVRFVIELDEEWTGARDILTDAEQVKHVEKLGDGTVLVTKNSCGACRAIEQNHGILRWRSFVGPNSRVYTVLFFRRQDLRGTIEDFREIGDVTLDDVSRFDDSGIQVTDRQHEVVEHALEAGYFEWPRHVTSEELAAELDISYTTLLEHLQKAESRLLRYAIDVVK
jgi:predicted DNA binding protein